MQKYILGKYANRTELLPLDWSPDSADSINPHMLITGASGGGKTTLLKNITKYLARQNKHIFVFDLKGDMIITDDDNQKIGNYIEFTAWDSKYGISPFEFDTGISSEELNRVIADNNMTKEQRFKLQNSGPKVQVDRVIEIIKKNFLPNMGTFQRDILMYLLSDTYLSKGFIYNKPETWLGELPSLKDTQNLIEKIKHRFNNGEDSFSIDDESIDFITSLQQKIEGIKSLETRKQENNSNMKDIETALEKLKKDSNSILDAYIEFGKGKYNDKNVLPVQEWFSARDIEFDKYSTKEAYRTVEKMSSYINALVDSGVFHSAKPPVKSGLNIINISGLDVGIQKFIVDVWIGKVFKSCKIRGTYSERANKKRGAKCDTFIIIDESKLIMGSSRDKTDPYSYINRIATESRGFGLGLIVAGQSASHFSAELLKNFDSQIILKTSIADFDTIRKSFGIDKEQLKYTQQDGYGNSLIKAGSSFEKIKLSS